MAPESNFRQADQQRPDVNLFALGGQDAPRLKELQNLPDGLRLIGVGRPSKEVAGWTASDWSKVEVIFKCGTGKDAPTQQELQDIWPLLTNLKWIHSIASGVEKLLIPEMAKGSVIVTNSRGPYSHSLAEWAITAFSYFAKDLPRLKAQQKDGNWESFSVEELRGKTLGVIGYGDIGQETANIARAFKMNIIALRRRTQLSKQEQDQGLKVYGPDQLEQLMSESDYVVNALPFTDATREVIDAKAIAKMKKSAVFVNVGRGKTVDEIALIKALQDKQIRGAGLDVTYTEPLPKDSPLWDLDNVLISPHSAARTEGSFENSTKLFGNLAKLYIEGGKLFNIVDPEEGY